MNNQIQQLIEQCESGGTWEDRTVSFDKEKFAKLILARVDYMLSVQQDVSIDEERNVDESFAVVRSDILEHFGVEL